jgi:hypothetical protein
MAAIGPGETCMTSYPDYLASSPEPIWVGGSVVAIRRDAFLRAEGFTSEWINAEDHDLLLRLGAAPGFVHVRGPVVAGYRQSPDSAVANLDRTLAGIRHLIAQEERGALPGGTTRRLERLAFLTRIIRPYSLEALRRGRPTDAWRLYRRSLRWHVLLGRWKYLSAFPFVAAKSIVGEFFAQRSTRRDRACDVSFSHHKGVTL